MSYGTDDGEVTGGAEPVGDMFDEVAERYVRGYEDDEYPFHRRSLAAFLRREFKEQERASLSLERINDENVDEIAQLRAEVERLQSIIRERTEQQRKDFKENQENLNEVERLRAEDIISRGLLKDAQAEVERLRSLLREAIGPDAMKEIE